MYGIEQLHDETSFNKYAEKCVHILIEHLANKPHLLLVLAMQCNKLLKNNTITHLKPHQSERLINTILAQFITAASNYVQQLSRATTKPKSFHDFSMNVYELYKDCKARIKTSCFGDYSQLLIECYRLCRMDADAEMPIASNTEFQRAISYYASELERRVKAQADQVSKKSTAKTNENDDTPSTGGSLIAAKGKSTKPQKTRRSVQLN